MRQTATFDGLMRADCFINCPAHLRGSQSSATCDTHDSLALRPGESLCGLGISSALTVCSAHSHQQSITFQAPTSLSKQVEPDKSRTPIWHFAEQGGRGRKGRQAGRQAGCRGACSPLVSRPLAYAFGCSISHTAIDAADSNFRRSHAGRLLHQLPCTFTWVPVLCDL